MLIARRIFIVVGLGLLLPLAFVMYVQIPFWYTAQTATANVVGFEMGKSSGNIRDRSYTVLYPVISFVTPQGDSIQARSLSGSTTAAFQLGEQIQLHYDPANPSQIVLPGYFSQWGGFLISSVFASVGILLLLTGLFANRHNTKLVLKKSSSGIKK